MDWLWCYNFVFENRIRLQYLLIMNAKLKFTMLWCYFALGSFLHDYMPLPPSYFSLRKNLFNTVFVKKGWGWTSGLLCAFTLSLLLRKKQNSLVILWKHLIKLIILTLTWYILTSTFEVIESYTGRCVGGESLYLKETCRSNGYLWSGFDISGHCFLLTFCTMVINEELLNSMDSVLQLKSYELQKKHKVFGLNFSTMHLCWLVEVASGSLMLLMVLWEVMLFFTCVYFHTLLQKFLGISFGFIAWHICYRYLFNFNSSGYLAPCLPGEL